MHGKLGSFTSALSQLSTPHFCHHNVENGQLRIFANTISRLETPYLYQYNI